MEIKFLKRNILQRILGLPKTPKPANTAGWRYADGRLTIDLKKTPELKSAGGAVRIEGGNLPLRVLVMAGNDGRYHAFHNRCTHLGHRRLDPVPGTATVQCCSVNKSTYDLEGRNVYGPAPEPIRAFPVEVAGDVLTVLIDD